MTMREQIMRQFYLSPAYDPKVARHSDVVKAAIGFTLDLITNPSDEMVERCAAALDHPSLYMGGPSEQSKRKARACLTAAVGDE